MERAENRRGYVSSLPWNVIVVLRYPLEKIADLS
jgi:hypothetical protein